MIIEKQFSGARYAVFKIAIPVGEKLVFPVRLHSTSIVFILSGAVQTPDFEVWLPLQTIQAPESLMAIGKIPAELIEIRTGSYLGDDDIVTS